MEKIILHGHELKITKDIDYQAPSDRTMTFVIEGMTRSPSDGYHTFDELYEQRATLWIALCRLYEDTRDSFLPSKVWCSKKHSDGKSYDGWFLLGIGLDEGRQMTYHLPITYWDEVINFADVLEAAPEFDGHSSYDVLDRIKMFIK